MTFGASQDGEMARTPEEIEAEEARQLKKLGALIKGARELRGMSQADVARALGISRQAVSMWEAGTNQPGPRRANALYELLGAKEAARMAADSGMRSTLAEKFASATDIPVLGTKPVEGSEDRFVFNTKELLWYPRPESLPAKGEIGCFAMPDASMMPWRFAGDPVFYDVDAIAKIGDHCLVRLSADGRPAPKGRYGPVDCQYVVRLLTGLTSEAARLKAYYPESEVQIPHAQIGRLSRIIDWRELFGPFVKVWQSSTLD